MGVVRRLMERVVHMAIKAIALDIDGTLTNDEKKSRRVRSAPYSTRKTTASS